jgi:UrcA family protein
MFNIIKYVPGALAAVLIVTGQGAALASSLQGSPGASSVRVSYADLDLSSPADVARLYQRIHRAAGSVCGPREFTGSHLALPSWTQCVANAVDSTVNRLELPALSAYHRGYVGETNRWG